MPLALFSASADAVETTRYTYDARGRLIAVAKTGGSADANTTYQFDKAANRTRKTVTKTGPEVGRPAPELIF